MLARRLGTPSGIELRRAAEADDGEGVRRAAHKLKRSCQNIGATFMATLCRALEAGDGEVGGAIDELDAALEPTDAAIRRSLAAA